MTAVLAAAALAVTAAGIVVAVPAAAVAGARTAARVLLDFLLAAGLLRLGADPSWPDLALTAAVVTLRHLLGAGLRLGARRPSGRRSSATLRG